MPKVQMPQLGESVAEGTIGKWLKQPGDHVDKYEPIVEVITDKVNAEVPSPFEGTLTQILVQEGETVPNNTDIAVIEGAADAAEAPAAAAPAPAAAAPAAAATVDETARRQPSPPDRMARAGPGGPTSPRHGRRAADCPAERVAGRRVGHDRRRGTRQCRVATATATAPSRGTYEGPTTPAVKRLAREHGVDLAMVAGTGHARPRHARRRLKFVESGRGTAPRRRRPCP